jgi:hypothetical protein
VAVLGREDPEGFLGKFRPGNNAIVATQEKPPANADLAFWITFN